MSRFSARGHGLRFRDSSFSMAKAGVAVSAAAAAAIGAYWLSRKLEVCGNEEGWSVPWLFGAGRWKIVGEVPPAPVAARVHAPRPEHPLAGRTGGFPIPLGGKGAEMQKLTRRRRAGRELARLPSQELSRERAGKDGDRYVRRRE